MHLVLIGAVLVAEPVPTFKLVLLAKVSKSVDMSV